MKLILLGPPGAGKGTQAAFLCRALDIVQISTGEMLRAAIAAGTPLGERVQQVLAAGDLVDDATIIELVKARIDEDDCQNGFLFDGFPRTIPQAEALVDADIAIDHVLEIRVPDDVVVERIAGRRIHEASGRTYHVRFDPPKADGVDDETGEPLVQRPDDREETVRDRLRVYREQTAPLIGFFRDLAAAGSVAYSTVDGTPSAQEINVRIARALDLPNS